MPEDPKRQDDWETDPTPGAPEVPSLEEQTKMKAAVRKKFSQPSEHSSIASVPEAEKLAGETGTPATPTQQPPPEGIKPKPANITAPGLKIDWNEVEKKGMGIRQQAQLLAAEAQKFLRQQAHRARLSGGRLSTSDAHTIANECKQKFEKEVDDFFKRHKTLTDQQQQEYQETFRRRELELRNAFFLHMLSRNLRLREITPGKRYSTMLGAQDKPQERIWVRRGRWIGGAKVCIVNSADGKTLNLSAINKNASIYKGSIDNNIDALMQKASELGWSKIRINTNDPKLLMKMIKSAYQHGLQVELSPEQQMNAHAVAMQLRGDQQLKQAHENVSDRFKRTEHPLESVKFSAKPPPPSVPAA